MVQPDGSFISFQAPKASKAQLNHEKPSLHVQLLDLCTNGKPLEGRTIQVTTWPTNPNTGQPWGLGNPRLFSVQELEGVGPYQAAAPIPADFLVDTLLMDDGAHGGQPAQQMPAMQQQPMVAQVAQQNPTAPRSVPAASPAVTAQVPAGMDPVVAAAMQNLGATNIQPVADAAQPVQGVVYDDCPF